jgi:hypothetical protein
VARQGEPYECTAKLDASYLTLQENACIVVRVPLCRILSSSDGTIDFSAYGVLGVYHDH